MPSIQNTIIEFNFTLLSGRIHKNKAKAGRHHVRYSSSPLLLDNQNTYIVYVSSRMPISLVSYDTACRAVSTGICCEICQGITSLRYGCTLALSPAQPLRRCGTRRLAPNPL